MKKIYKNLYTVFIISFISACYPFLNPQAAEYVIPSGQTVGIKIYTDGLIVAKTDDFTDINGNRVCPAKEAGIKTGDIIKTINGAEISSCEALQSAADGNPIMCEVSREGEMMNILVSPQKAEDGQYRIGVWARDSTAGIGTVTFVNPDTMRYTALGHAVTDIDTGNIMSVKHGNIQSCGINSVTKGHIGFPGSVSADFYEEELGTVDVNGENGIAGSALPVNNTETAEMAEISDIHSGDAVVLSDVMGGEVRSYSARVDIISEEGVRNMVVEITDKELIDYTGGIVQGMSGAPLMQDGRLIGAVTHVFVNDPHKGYAIFAKNLAA